MKNPELYHKTIGILVKAYQDDTLVHGNCRACAVGNIVAANMGIENIFSSLSWKLANTTDPNDPDLGMPLNRAWSSVFCTSSKQRINPEEYADEAKRQIDSTGYCWQDLAKIEYAFETALMGDNEDEWMFNGLMAVVDVLNEIHEVEKDASKELFVKEVAQ